VGPSIVIGGSIAFTREPSTSLASQSGIASSMCRPTVWTMFSIRAAAARRSAPAPGRAGRVP
jgi:hypothetical protein